MDGRGGMSVPGEGRRLLSVLVGDGRPVLSLAGVMLVLAGAFALFLSATGHFLPHDVAFLGMEAEELCEVNQCRVVHFMFHDRVAFGGTLIAVGTLYLWLTAVPLAGGEAWAWWTLALSGAVGFASFLAYLGYGYLDTWHGAATLVLLPMFGVGLARSWRALPMRAPVSVLWWPGQAVTWWSRFGVGRLVLLVTAACLCLGGAIILVVGVTTVFVPQDLAYMGLSAAELHAINPRLVPLIAHDRAGFGGGVLCCGVTMLLAVLHGRPSRALWQTLFIVGAAGFGTAIGVHPAIGYNDFVHLAPAYLGAVMFAVGLVLTWPGMMGSVGALGALETTGTPGDPAGVEQGMM